MSSSRRLRILLPIVSKKINSFLVTTNYIEL
nr:MAG TPA: hypothetical protein [Caudoviricetes sp.]